MRGALLLPPPVVAILEAASLLLFMKARLSVFPALSVEGFQKGGNIDKVFCSRHDVRNCAALAADSEIVH